MKRAVAFLFTCGCSLAFDANDLRARDGGDNTSDAGADGKMPPPPPSTCNVPGYACVANAPSGWSGPFALYDGLPANAPSCGEDIQVVDAKADLVTPAPAVCGGCTCSASNVACSPVTIESSGQQCGSCNSSKTNLNGSCQYFSYGTFICNGTSPNALYVGKNTNVISGTCTPDAPKPMTTVPPLSFNRKEVGCRGANARVDCDQGFVCATTPKPPFAKGMCVFKDGDLPACPGAPYTMRSIFYKNVSDTRTCSACGCGATPDPIACTASVITSTSDNTCMTGNKIPLGQCTADFPGYVKATVTPPQKTTCPATGGTPTGTATPSDPVTVCCAP